MYLVRVAIYHLNVHLLTDNLAADVPFVTRIVIQGLLPGLPPDLSHEVQNLSASMSAVLPGLNHEAGGITESCPACHVEVPLVDITRAVCENGHVWGAFPRCGIAATTNSI